MVLLIIIPIKWLFHWDIPYFQTNPYSRYVVPCFWPGFFAKLLTMSARSSWDKIQDATAMMFSPHFPYFYQVSKFSINCWEINTLQIQNGHETDNPWPKFQKDPKSTPSHEDSCQSMGLGGQFQPKCAIICRISRDLTNLRQTYLHNLMVLHFWDLRQILHHYPFVVFGSWWKSQLFCYQAHVEKPYALGQVLPDWIPWHDCGGMFCCVAHLGNGQAGRDMIFRVSPAPGTRVVNWVKKTVVRVPINQPQEAINYQWPWDLSNNLLPSPGWPEPLKKYTGFPNEILIG